MAQLYGLKALYPEQKRKIKDFGHGKNIYFSAGTGFGKSIPWVFDQINEQVVGTSTLIVIRPLIIVNGRSNCSLAKVGFSAICIHQNSEKNEKVIEIQAGIYSLHLRTCCVKMCGEDFFPPQISGHIHCIGVVIDEAHVIAQW